MDRQAKTTIGYEIPFPRYFYKYVEPEKSEKVAVRIKNIEQIISASLDRLFSTGGDIK